MLLFMKQKDKHNIDKYLCCPPHYLPHKLPIGEKIDDEPCHIHNNKLRMIHHSLFCKYILNCPHYKLMMDFYKSNKEKINVREMDQMGKRSNSTF